MNAARKATPPVPGVDNLRATLRRRHQGEDGADQSTDTGAGMPVDESTGTPMGAHTDVPADDRADARTGAPGRVRTEPAVSGAERDAEAQTLTIEGSAPDGDAHDALEAVQGAEKIASSPPAGLRRELEVAARSYRGGLAKLAPRVDRLAAAARAVIESGGSAAEVRAMLTEVGIEPEDIPRSVQAAFKRRA